MFSYLKATVTVDDGTLLFGRRIYLDQNHPLNVGGVPQREGRGGFLAPKSLCRSSFNVSIEMQIPGIRAANSQWPNVTIDRPLSPHGFGPNGFEFSLAKVENFDRSRQEKFDRFPCRLVEFEDVLPLQCRRPYSECYTIRAFLTLRN